MTDKFFALRSQPPKSMTDEMIEKLKGDHFPTNQSDFLNETIGSFFDKRFAENKLRKSDIIREANIARAYGFQIFKGEKIATRDYYLSIAIAMRLDLPTTQRLLALTETGPLHPLILRDASIIYAIIHGFTLDQTYNMLVSLNLPPIRTDSKKKSRKNENEEDEE